MELDKSVKIFQDHYNQWLNNKDRNNSGYEYEQSFVGQMQRMEKIKVLRENLPANQ